MAILVFAPHADDEVLGLGGTIARHAADGEKIILAVLTGSGKEDHPLWPKSVWEVIRCECRKSSKILGISEVIFEDLPAACLDSIASWKINKVVDSILQKVQPTMVYVPIYMIYTITRLLLMGFTLLLLYLNSATSIQKILAMKSFLRLMLLLRILALHLIQTYLLILKRPSM